MIMYGSCCGEAVWADNVHCGLEGAKSFDRDKWSGILPVILKSKRLLEKQLAGGSMQEQKMVLRQRLMEQMESRMQVD